ncbi:MAG: TIGR01777 family protein [Acidobacteria bacterium]|nr:MAG: TIGR01777 family protein [Acidobacteriota bacterium]
MALAKTERKPGTFICASAIGYYGNRGDGVLTEDSLSGEGFFPEVCREWEFATEPAADIGIRVVNLRTGIVLSREGGALKQMLLPFRLGLGGRIGDGRQWWSWIHIADLVSAVHHILQNDSLRGAVNMTAPNPVTNAEFTSALSEALKRPARLPVPAFALRLLFGELADEGLLASARVVPEKLAKIGFAFAFPELKPALKDLL